jgi:hypothetical protein
LPAIYAFREFEATFQESVGRYERATAPERALYEERTAQFERALFLE